MEEGGSIHCTENKTQCGIDPKLGMRRQTLVDVSNIPREDQMLLIMKENAHLKKTARENSKQIEAYKEEVENLKIALQGSRQQNCQLAKTNSQMLAELNLGKDRLKELQHELQCTTLVLQQKKIEFQDKQRLNKKIQQPVRAQGKPADVAAADAAIGGKGKKNDSESNSMSSLAPRQKLDERKPVRRQSIAKAQTISSSNLQSVKTASCSGSSVPLHEEARRFTRRSIRPSCGPHTAESADDSSKMEDSCTQMEEAAASGASCMIQEDSNCAAADPETISNIPVLCASKSEPNNLLIKEENTSAENCSNVMSGPRARVSLSSSSRPLRRAVEKVVSYKEPSVRVKMRRVD